MPVFLQEEDNEIVPGVFLADRDDNGAALVNITHQALAG
jgi:hypothetical protein